MVNLPTIDIIIPNYNKGKYIEECINSVLNQSYKNWQLYFIDDNSTDNSREIISKFKNFKNIKIFNLEKNMGPSYCRNLGIKNSLSDYIAFLDSDDFWPKNKLDVQINAMIRNDLNFSYTDLKFFLNNDLEKIHTTDLPNFYDYKKFIFKSTMSTSSIILKKKILGNTSFKDVMHEDYLFKCDLLRKEITASKVRDTFVYYRLNKKNRSSNKVSNIYNLWKINKNYNNLDFLNNLKSIINISINSIRIYGWK